MLNIDNDVCACVCSPGVSLTQSLPQRAAGHQRYSASTWRRDTVKLFSVSSALMTFSSPDPKVNSPQFLLLPSFPHLTLLLLISIPCMSPCYSNANFLHIDMLFYTANKT